MRLKWNLVWLGLLAGVALNCAGCGGFTGSQSVSPATFLLPGLLKNDTNTNDTTCCTNALAVLKLDTTRSSDSTEITSVR